MPSLKSTASALRPAEVIAEPSCDFCTHARREPANAQLKTSDTCILQRCMPNETFRPKKENLLSYKTSCDAMKRIGLVSNEQTRTNLRTYWQRSNHATERLDYTAFAVGYSTSSADPSARQCKGYRYCDYLEAMTNNHKNLYNIWSE